MTRFYFDFRDDEGVDRDEEGIELADMDAAVAEAKRALAEMIRETLPDSETVNFEIDVRSEAAGPVVLTVKFNEDWPH